MATANETTVRVPFILSTRYVYRKADFETAAWWEDQTIEPGTFEAVFVSGDKPYLSKAGVFVVAMPATVTDDYFPALWGGVPVSPYKAKHIGQSRTVRLTFPIDRFVTDARFVVSPDNLASLCDFARTELAKDFRHYQDWVERAAVPVETERTNPNGVWATYGTALGFLTETIRRIDEVRTFQGWHGYAKFSDGAYKQGSERWYGYKPQAERS